MLMLKILMIKDVIFTFKCKFIIVACSSTHQTVINIVK